MSRIVDPSQITEMTVTMTSQGSLGRDPMDTRCYLLYFAGESSGTFDLPANGEIIVGRSPEADLHISDTLVSRKHAQLLCLDGYVRIADLASRHGTTVNGERLTAPRHLMSGDVVTLGHVTLVLHRAARPVVTRPVLDAAGLRRRLEDEIDRALRYERELALVVACLGDQDVDRARVTAALAGKLRLIDAAGFLSSTHLAMLMPELAADQAEAALERLIPVLSRVAPQVRIGLALCPTDGCDADTLLATARGAADAAHPGGWSQAMAAASSLSIGEQRILVADPAMRRVHDLLERLARSDLPILITGETGTGKEIAARAVHHWSPRKDRPLVAINCAALPEALVESELFGHEKGAFTGAGAAKMGLLESASGGTVFLDELGELSASVQAKLLRALETQRITRVGDVRERQIEFRLIAATHRDLQAEVAAGRFRQDLFFRLSAARVILPPLRDRPRELPLLARGLLAAACARMGRDPLELSPAAMKRLFAHDWPGNVRELKNAMDFAAATTSATESYVEPWHLPADLADLPGSADAEPGSADAEPDTASASSPSGSQTVHFRPIADEVAELERMRMVQALAATDGVQNRAAELISMPLRTFVTKLKRYGIRPGTR